MKQKELILLFVLIIFFLVSLLGYSIIKKGYTQTNNPKTAPRIPRISVSPSQSTDSNVDKDYKRITTKSPLSLTLDIPKTATLELVSNEDEDWGITINYKNLKISYCTGCDWMGGECGGITLDNCTSKNTNVGNSKLSEYFLKSDPNYLIRATSIIETSDIRTTNLFIETNNHKGLTLEEIHLLEKINSSIHNN